MLNIIEYIHALINHLKPDIRLKNGAKPKSHMSRTP